MSSHSGLPNNWSLLGELACLFCKPFDNKFSLQKYTERELIMIGDRVEFERFFIFRTIGTVSQIHSEWGKKLRVRSVYVDVNGRSIRICAHRLKILQRGENFKGKWNEVFGSEFQFYDELLKKRSSGKPDDLSVSAQGTSGQFFFWGFGLVLANEFPKLIPEFFERAIAEADKITEIYPKTEASYGDTSNHLNALRYKAYACLMLNGVLPQALVSEISRVTQVHSGDIPPSHWGPENQDEFLSAVRLAILSDDTELAKQLLGSKRSFSGHKDQVSLLRKILRETKNPADDSALRQSCFDYLDYVRRPGSSDYSFFGTTEPGLEWGYIVVKLFNNPSIRLNWTNLLEIIYSKNYS